MASVARKVLQSTALPITTAEFRASLLKICPISEKGTIGLAISGGVDSMALAHLSSQVQHEQSGAKLKLRAFIVDHGARVDSQVEAQKVFDVLTGKGIPSEVLTIRWPQDEEPSQSPMSFESLARKHRYQVLGKACRDLSIRSFLLAHHEDDQAETLFMRLMDGHLRRGLQGMASFAGIPECHGIYGVHQSGSPRVSEVPNSRSFLVEEGGITIYRPLLSFSKDRLIATCHEADMPWFEDPTNQDATLTKRNAVRHIMKAYTLPAALSRPSLLALGKRVREWSKSLEKKADMWLQKCRVMKYYPESGVLIMHFTKSPFGGETSEREIAARMLRKMIRQITPLEHVKLDSLHSCVDRIIPGMCSGGHQEVPKAYNVAGILFTPIPAKSDATISQDHRNSTSWMLSRQIPIAGRHPELSVNVVSIHSDAQTFTHWQLFDNRYWIRFSRPTDAKYRLEEAIMIRLRLLRREDLEWIRKRMPKPSFEKFRRLLKIVAPGDLRYTIPVMQIGEEVIGLPTLGMKLNGLNEDRGEVDWEVRSARGDLKWDTEKGWRFREAEERGSSLLRISQMRLST